MLYGGSRSGKTFIIIFAIIIRALKKKSRHVILRAVFNHIKTSIWYDTLPKVMDLCFPGVEYYQNKSDWYIKFSNGSEVWIGGLDDKQRTEKILGNEYSSIYYNESSQMSYASVVMAYSRLAERSGLANKFYYDCNPPLKTHWTYKVFKLFINPLAKQDDSKKYLDKEKYASMMLHPSDNIENQSDDYIKDILENLDENNRKRFLDGEWSEISERCIMKNWSVGGDIEIIDGIPTIDGKQLERIPSGLDFGFRPHPATVTDLYLLGEDTLVWDEIVYETGLSVIKTDDKLLPSIQQRLEDAKFDKDHIIVADSSRNDSIAELRGNGYNVFAVQKPPVIDGLNMLLSFKHILTEKSVNIKTEFENYVRAIDKERNILPTPIKEWDHAIDGGKYSVWMKGRLW